MVEIWLKRNRKRRLEAGHPWVFRSEADSVRGTPETGGLVAIRNHQGHYLATGFYHATSQIAVRVASYDEKEPIDVTWLRRRLGTAWSYRKRLLPSTGACRAVYGEADGLPGLIVDKYGAVAVVQILSAALDMRRDWIAPALRDVLGVAVVYERSDAPVRQLEGLKDRTGCLLGDCPEVVTITESGLKFSVDIITGQKTGHFFDQRENRLAIAPLVRWAVDERPRPDQRFRDSEMAPGEGSSALQAGATDNPSPGRLGAQVLDCFAHTGAFAVHAAHFGAASVTAVDISEQAIARAKVNAELNGYADRCEFVVANAFDLLREYERVGRAFDVVILDPPAFAKSRGAVDSALRGYKEINLRAMKLVRHGGFLVTASCSSHVTPDMWRGVIAEAAMDAKKILRLVEYRSAGKDHPQLVGMAENDYLKFAMYSVHNR